MTSHHDKFRVKSLLRISLFRFPSHVSVDVEVNVHHMHLAGLVLKVPKVGLG